MRISPLQELSGRVGPFVSVAVDVSRNDETAARELADRWADLDRELAAAGAAEHLRKPIGEVVLEPTGRPGSVGRLLVADADGIALDLVLPSRPARDQAVYGPIPLLLPAFRALGDSLPYLLAEVDRTGADITVVNALGVNTDRLEVQGSHDVIHRVAGGQLSGKRLQHRAEDSWERNAAEVAGELEELIGKHRPAVVILDGDSVAVGHVIDAAGGRLRELAVRLKSGARADGASVTARDAEITGVLVQQRRSLRADLMDRFGIEEGRQQAAVQGLDSVVDAARRAQIQDLLLHDDPQSTHQVWVGSAPGQLGLTRDEVLTLGAAEPVKVRADNALVWAAINSDAGVTLLDPDDRALSDGIGALLRWSDLSTPHDAIPSMPGHGTNKGAHHRGL
jgi:hypothetical protein